MSTEALVVFACDRDGKKVTRAVNPELSRVVDEKLPDGWGRLDPPHGPIRLLCEECLVEFDDWYAKAPPGPWPADARRFARWFLQLPYERRDAWLREQGFERVKAEPVAAGR